MYTEKFGIFRQIKSQMLTESVSRSKIDKVRIITGSWVAARPLIPRQQGKGGFTSGGVAPMPLESLTEKIVIKENSIRPSLEAAIPTFVGEESQYAS
jgi:hypothetical protein